MNSLPGTESSNADRRFTHGRARIGRVLRRAQLCILMAAILPLHGPMVVPQAPIVGRISEVVPFLGILVGWKHRNRVYRNAEQFISERNEYYDGLRETLRSQLVQRQIYGLRPSQVAAYVKTVALLEQQRAVELKVAEARKRGARAEFLARVEESVTYAIMGSRLAQELIGAMKDGVGSAQQALDRALGSVTGGASDVLRDLQRIRTIASQLSLVGGAVGGETGYRLREISDRIVKTIDQPGKEARATLESVRGELQGLNKDLDTLAKAARAPSAGEVAAQLVARLPPGGKAPENVSIETIAGLLSRREVGNESLTEEAKAAVKQGFVARCAALAQAYEEQLAALREGDAAPPPSGLLAKCLALQRGELKQLGQAAIPKPGPEPAAPEKPAALPRITASGQFAETVTGSGNDSVPMGTTFELTADWQKETISGSLRGSRTTKNNAIYCSEETDPSIIYDEGRVDYTDTYNASFDGVLDPLGGQFTIEIAPKGNTTDIKTKPFTVDHCQRFNAAPAPGSNPFSGTGTISGYVSLEGAIEFTTRWTAGSVVTGGSWSGQGSVVAP